MIDLTARITRAPGLQAARISADELIILGGNSEFYLGLDASGVAIWDRLDAPMSVGKLVEDLCSLFQGNRQTIEADVMVFIEQLIDENVVITVD